MFFKFVKAKDMNWKYWNARSVKSAAGSLLSGQCSSQCSVVETSSARGGRGTSHTGEEPGEGASRNEQHSHLSHSHLGGSRQLEKADRAATASHSVLRLRCQNWCWGAWGSAQEGVDMLERGWREPTFEDEQMQKRSPPDSSPPPPCLALQKSELMMVHRGHQLRVSNDQPFIVALLQPTKCTQKLSSECEHRFTKIEFHTKLWSDNIAQGPSHKSSVVVRHLPKDVTLPLAEHQSLLKGELLYARFNVPESSGSLTALVNRPSKNESVPILIPGHCHMDWGSCDCPSLAFSQAPRSLFVIITPFLLVLTQ